MGFGFTGNFAGAGLTGNGAGAGGGLTGNDEGLTGKGADFGVSKFGMNFGNFEGVPIGGSGAGGTPPDIGMVLGKLGRAGM